MPQPLSEFERALLEEFCFHRPAEREQIARLAVERRDAYSRGVWTTFENVSVGPEYSLSLDSEIELASGVPVDAELWFRGDHLWRLHVWCPVHEWDGNTSAGFTFHEA